MKKNKKTKKENKTKEGSGKKILHYALSVAMIVAVFVLNSVNVGLFLNDGWLYVMCFISFFAGGAIVMLAPGKIAALSFRNKFSASVGFAILAWGILDGFNIYYSRQQPLKERIVNVDDISIRSRSGIKVTLYFTVDGKSNTYSGSGLKAIPITYDNVELYKKSLRLKLVYRKGILGSYVLMRPVKVIR